MNETREGESKEPITPRKEPERPDSGGTPDPDSEKDAVQCWLAEYNSLRNQVLNSMQIQHNLIWVNISVVGAIITVYFTYWQERDFLVFLAIPVVSGLLGLYWVNQGRQTAEIGHYIHQRVRLALQRLCHDEGVIGWDEFIRKGIERTSRTYVTDTLSLRVPRAVAGLTFALPCLIAVGLTATNLKCASWQVALIWSVGLVLTIWLMIASWRLGIYWMAAVPRESDKAV